MMVMFKNKILIFIILIIALLSIGVASAEESSMNATDTVSLDYDDSSTEVVTSANDENTSLDVASKDNNIETSSDDVKTFNSFSNENTLDDAKSSNSDNTTFYNNDLISSSNSATQNDILTSDEPETFTQLNEAISSDTTGTLTLNSNYKRVEGESDITISKDITIDGKGFTIDANKLGRIFYVNNGCTLSLTNITLANGKTTDNGGAIFNDGALTLTNVTFVNNSASYGGAICNYDGVFGFTVSGCSFVNNSASYGAAIFNGASDFAVTNSVFVNNSANNGDSIYSSMSCTANDNWWGTNTPTWSDLVSDEVTHDSYAVLSLTATSDNVTINFYKSGTTNAFNEIPTRDVSLTITNQETIYGEITDGTFNKAYAAPAGEYNVTAVVDNQKLVIGFLNNVYVDPEGSDLNSGADWKNAVKTIELAMEIVLANGKIYLADGTHKVDNLITIDKTVAIVGNGTKTFITNNKKGYGIFRVTASGVAIYNSTFANNSAYEGGAIYNDGGSSLTVDGCSFVNNSASGSGGAIFNTHSGFAVRNCSFVNNSASGSGGAIVNQAFDFTVTNSVFVNNSVNKGGAIDNEAFDFTVTNSVFVNNTASKGNSIYSGWSCTANDNWWGTNTPDWNKLVYGSVAHESYAVLNLTATSDNIAIKFYKNGTTKVLPFTRDLSLTIGNQPDTSNEIVNGTFETDYVIPTLGEYKIKATVDNQKLTVTLTNNNVYVNPDGSNDNTGASWSSPFKTIQHAMDNVPANGNIYLSDGTHEVASQITIGKAVTIIGNGTKTVITTDKKDRVFEVSVSGVAIYNSSFVNDSVSGYGGGAICVGSSVSGISVGGCSFVNNSASYGGAIYVSSDISGLIVSGCSFVNNSASYGGAIDNRYCSSSSVINSKFDNNTANKGVIYNSGTLTLNNNTYSRISEGKTYIYLNNGTLSSVVVTVLGNETIKTNPGENITLYATITCDGVSVAGGVLNFTIDGVNYTADSQNNGIYNCTYTVAFDNCKVVSASFANATNSTIQTGILNARNDANLTVDNVVMFYHDGTHLIAKLLDAKGNSIANTTISFTINGVTYNKTTNTNGTASLAINLDYGLYNTVISYAGNETYNPASVNATVEVKSSIIGQNLVKMYQNNTQFFTTFIDSNGKVLANTNVTFNVNGVFYTRTTDVNGTARLNINLNPGNYTLTAYNLETGEQQGFNVLVKSLIEASDLTKYYNNESKFQVKIYNKDGSLAVNKSVTFNINGVLYTRETNANGIVSLAINLKLGDYIITTMLEGLEISNNVKVLPTLITNDLTMGYRDGSTFNATFLDAHGNPLANQTLRFNVNGVFYNRVSDENGIASLNINLLRENIL